MNDILFRSASPARVRFERRQIDVLAVPYGTPTAVRDYDGSEYIETIAPGAFGTVEGRASRIKVLRDHRPDRSIGKCVTLDAGRAEGLFATLEISDTELGRESLTLAADGVLDVSVGFSPKAHRWNADRTAVTRSSVWLHELSLVPLPAYDTARVLAVRSEAIAPQPARVPTPRLDEVRTWLIDLDYRGRQLNTTA